MAAQKDAVVNAIRAEINLATAQELITVCIFVMHRTIYLMHMTQKTSEKCFAKCIPKPGVSLTSSEEVRSSISFWDASWPWLTELLSADVLDTMHGSLLGGM